MSTPRNRRPKHCSPDSDCSEDGDWVPCRVPAERGHSLPWLDPYLHSRALEMHVGLSLTPLPDIRSLVSASV